MLFFILFSITNIYVFFGTVVFCHKRLLQYLRYFQQEEYNTKRFINWYIKNKAFDRKGSIVSLIAIGLLCINFAYNFLIFLLYSIVLIGIANSEADPRITGKITLKMTARAKRIFYTSLLFALVTLISVIFILHTKYNLLAFDFIQLFYLILLFQILPVFLLLSTILLSIDESRRRKVFINEAKEKLKLLNPYVIGITGSYGKTSTKVVLAKLLETSLAPTFAPPKSINTAMGITREIRERLEPFQKYAVIEMGAYLQGSIKKLCNLTPPKAGIITAVGLAHLERFKTPENVLLAKSELAQAIPADGILVCNGDNVGARKISELHTKATTKLYGLNKDSGYLDYLVTDLKFSNEGSTFKINFSGQSLDAFTKLSGRPNISNILASFALAHTLGANPELLLAAIRNLEPIDNRLEVRKMGHYTQINDAYNSNPEGFAAALEVLEQLSGNQKILMTPGMIEFGDQEFELNKNIAKIAAKICSRVIIVGSTNKKALEEGLLEGGFARGNIIFAENRTKAFEFLTPLIQAYDIVLIENDLLDLYETDISF